MARLDGPWFPTIYSDKCDGCAKTGKPRCIDFCRNNVFTLKDGKAEVTNPDNCGGGSITLHCSACAPLCPKKAIVFPSSFSSFGSLPRREDSKDLLRKAKCKVCGKIYWTNGSRDLCFDCQSH